MVDKGIDIPLYSQLKEELVRKIKGGAYKPGETIPSENELSELYGMSRPTVRQAIGDLAAKGYLDKVKGKGTFVKEIPGIVSFNHERGFLHTVLGCNDKTHRTVLHVEIVDGENRIRNETINQLFRLEYMPSTQNRFIRAELLYENNKLPIYAVSYLPERYFHDGGDKLQNNAIALEMIGSHYPLDPMHCKCKAYVISAEERESSMLHVPLNSPVLVMENILVGRNGSIVEFCMIHYSSMSSMILFMKSRDV